MNPNYVLRVHDLTKTFAGVKALDNVRLDIERGEVHALMGENGAGKSTLMKILMGLYVPDSGEIVFDGSTLNTGDVGDMLKRGISMIHQEMLVVPELTVAQNIFLGRETKWGVLGWLDDRTMHQRADELLTQMGVSINARTRMKHLSVAEMQMVEIAKAISNDARVIIMDEPTSALSDREVATLFGIIRDLKTKGVAIIYTSHKMDEIFAIADTITVLRDGQYIDTRPATQLNPDTLVSLMVGREIDTLFPVSTAEQGREVLSVRGLGRTGHFDDVNFTVHEGEVLGIAGLMGAGRTEIARVLYGLDQADRGDIYVREQPIEIRSPQDAIRHGIGYVSEDRKGWGFVPGMSVKQNLTLSSLPKHVKGGFIQERSEEAAAVETMASLRIKATGPNQNVTFLSGGNQQKVVIGKVLRAAPSLIILDEPTRGIDVGAKAEIYKLIRQLANDGLAIILISSELPEILGLSDKILVLAKGKQTALLSMTEATPETIMQYAVQP